MILSPANAFLSYLTFCIIVQCTCRCVAGYDGNNVKKPIILLGSGVGAREDVVDDVKTHCPENHVAYVYLRMV